MASLLVELGRSDEARAIYDEISDSASQIGALEAQRRVAVYRIAQELTERRWADLDRRCAEARALRVDEGNAWFGVALAYCEARLALHEGNLDVARARLGPDTVLQGNLDPVVCLASWPSVEEAVLDVLERNDGHPGHIFNLGHGVLPETDPAILEQVVQLVHSETQEAP